MNRILLGDCIDVLRALPSGFADLAVTDPPYAVRYRDRHGRTVLSDDRTDWLLPAFRAVYRALKQNALCVSFYSWNQIDKFMAAWKDAGFYPVAHFVWAKPYASRKRFAAYRHELAYLLAKGRPAFPAVPPPDVLPWQYTGNRLHPTQKPVSALVPLIEAFSQPGEVILDPFGGSGTTAVAARQLRRRFVLIEKDQRHWQTAVRRLADFVKDAA